VKLEKATRPSGASRPPLRIKSEASGATKKPKSAIGGSEIVNPWGS
jgi:hypothetical protein